MEAAPLASIVIPARDEEKYLPACVKAIHRSAEAAEIPYEIVVVLNRCKDRTEEIARELGCRLTRCDEKNLSKIRNMGAGIAQGDILITIDADSVMSEGLIGAVIKKLRSPKVIGGGVMIYPSRWSLGIFFTALCLVPIAVWHRISGGVFFCRKKDFVEIGGFKEQLASVEDIDFARRLRAHGVKKGMRYITLLKNYIVTSTRKFDHLGDWFFLRHPILFLRLLNGKDREGANRIWYDFRR